VTAVEELMEAVARERREWSDFSVHTRDGRIHHALADLLDAHAGDWDASDEDDYCGPDDECFECSRNKAVLRVARAINGGVA